MARKKSIADIADQTYRLQKTLESNWRNKKRPATGWTANEIKDMFIGNTPFAKMQSRINEISSRYENNIVKTKEFQRARKSGGYDAANNIKVSQRIYMGLSNG